MGYRVWGMRGMRTDALSFFHRNIRGWLEGLRAHPARRALLVDAKERDYKKAEAMRVPDYVSIRDRPLESIGDAIDSPRYEDYLKNLPLEDVKNWLSICWSWDASPIQKGGLTGGAYDTWAALCELFGAMDPDSKFGTARFAPSIPTWGKEFQRHAVRSGSTRGHPYRRCYLHGRALSLA
eukprot:g34535.t1